LTAVCKIAVSGKQYCWDGLAVVGLDVVGNVLGLEVIGDLLDLLMDLKLVFDLA